MTGASGVGLHSAIYPGDELDAMAEAGSDLHFGHVRRLIPLTRHREQLVSPPFGQSLIAVARP